MSNGKRHEAQKWTAYAFMVVTGLAGLGVLAVWLGWYALHLVGVHGGLEHACEQIIGTWDAILGSTALLLVSSVFAGGSPGQTGKNMMDALISRVKKGE